MPIRSLSFDDEDEDDLFVFSGYDLLLAHYDEIDLDWYQVSERSAIDARRGLVITQAAVIEDLIDEFLLYLIDPRDQDAYQRTELERRTFGSRIALLREWLTQCGLIDDETKRLLNDLDAVCKRRNQLAHGRIECWPTKIVPIRELPTTDIEIAWHLIDRRAQVTERISMAGLREDVHEAQGCFMSLLKYGERFVEIAPHPTHFRDGQYLASPTP